LTAKGAKDSQRSRRKAHLKSGHYPVATAMGGVLIWALALVCLVVASHELRLFSVIEHLRSIQNLDGFIAKQVGAIHDSREMFVPVGFTVSHAGDYVNATDVLGFGREKISLGYLGSLLFTG
jgi:hypothetical protein